MNFNQAKESIISSPASMFTKDDVLALLHKIENGKDDTVEFNRFCECLEQFMHNSNMQDFTELDYSNAEIELYDKEISVTEVPVFFDNDSFIYQFKNAIDILK